MDYFALPGRSYENLDFPAHKWHTAEKNVASSQKTFGQTRMASQMAKLFVRENKIQIDNFFQEVPK